MVKTVVELRPEERRLAAGAFLTLFGILAAHTLLETARDALFLSRLPATQLPWVYLAMALLAVAISSGPRLPARPVEGRYGLSILLVAASAVTFSFWVFGTWRSGAMLRALYVWTGIVGTLTGVKFWLVLGELYTVTQAKRLYRVIAAGSLLGAVVGAALARAITIGFPAQHLVLASALVLALTGAGPALVVRRPEGVAPSGGRTSIAEALALVRRQPYIKGLAVLTLVSTVALTLADYVFKSMVARTLQPAQLGAFFASFYMVLNVLALVAQVFLMGWLLRVFGVHYALWTLPLLIFLGAAGVALGGGLLAALLLKGADGTLRHSVHRTGTELLFVPIPDGVRERAKPFIDVVGQRGGQAVASLFILSELVLQRGEVVLAAAAAGLSVVWIAWVSDLRRHYLDLFRNALRSGFMGGRAELPDLDLASLETLFGALNSRDDAEVVAALEILEQEGRARLIPALILYHPSPTVVVRALEVFTRAERSDFVPIADRLLGHGDPEVRAAALRARTTVRPDEDALLAGARDPSPLVRATALAAAVAGGGPLTDDTRALLDELRGSDSAEVRRALARAIAKQPSPLFEEILLKLADSPEDEVQAEVAQAMGAVHRTAFLPALLPMLARHEVRGAARAALVAFGAPALAFLDEALGDRHLPHEVRRHIPRTISQFPGAEAAPILLRHLLEEQDGMVRFKILRGLGRIAADNPELPLDRTVLRAATARTVEACFRLLHWRVELSAGARVHPWRRTPGHELLVQLLRDKEVHALERLFRLLGLQHRREDFERIYHGLRNSNPKVRASSRELLEHVLSPPLGPAVLALVDEIPDDQRLARAGPYYTAGPLDYEALLAILLEQPGETLRCIAAYHVGELGLVGLKARLESFRAENTGFFVTRVVERALRLLSGEDGERLAPVRT